jgi:hypothetical protein
VVGVISGTGLPTIRQPAASGLLRGLVLMSEITMALFIFSLTVLAIDNVSFLPALLADPVAGFAHGVERMTALSLR